jgi:hypothetical protein
MGKDNLQMMGTFLATIHDARALQATNRTSGEGNASRDYSWERISRISSIAIDNVTLSCLVLPDKLS